jgi:hypothetical protein
MRECVYGEGGFAEQEAVAGRASWVSGSSRVLSASFPFLVDYQLRKGDFRAVNTRTIAIVLLWAWNRATDSYWLRLSLALM